MDHLSTTAAPTEADWAEFADWADAVDRDWWDSQTVDPTGITFPALPPVENYTFAPPVASEPEPADADRSWWATAADEPDPDTMPDWDALYGGPDPADHPATLGIGHPSWEV